MSDIRALLETAQPGEIRPLDLGLAMRVGRARARRVRAIAGSAVLATVLLTGLALTTALPQAERDAIPAAPEPDRGDIEAEAETARYRDWYMASGAMTPSVGIGQVVTLNASLVPQRGDIVGIVVDDGVNDPFETLSRVVGLPGDTVECPVTAEGFCEAVIVSGERLDEPWITTPTPAFAATAVPEGHVFLLGDQRDAARDSSDIGPQRADGIFGVAVARVTGTGQREPIPGTPQHATPRPGDAVTPAEPVPSS